MKLCHHLALDMYGLQAIGTGAITNTSGQKVGGSANALAIFTTHIVTQNVTVAGFMSADAGIAPGRWEIVTGMACRMREIVIETVTAYPIASIGSRTILVANKLYRLPGAFGRQLLLSGPLLEI